MKNRGVDLPPEDKTAPPKRLRDQEEDSGRAEALREIKRQASA